MPKLTHFRPTLYSFMQTARALHQKRPEEIVGGEHLARPFPNLKRCVATVRHKSPKCPPKSLRFPVSFRVRCLITELQQRLRLYGDEPRKVMELIQIKFALLSYLTGGLRASWAIRNFIVKHMRCFSSCQLRLSKCSMGSSRFKQKEI